MSSDPDTQKLMHSVLEADKETIEDGKLLNEAINQGLNSFVPDAMFEQLVSNYKLAKQIYGESLLRQISGYSDDYLERNLRIPEFRKELKKKITQRVKELEKKEYIDASGMTDKAFTLASLVNYAEEVDHLTPKGIFGERLHKKASHYGDKQDSWIFKKGDRYKDIDVTKSVKVALRRGHKKISREDLRKFERQSKGTNYIIYAVDASGSMKGKKIETAKKAGIALAFKAIAERDKVGLIVFGSEVTEAIHPTDDFPTLLAAITRIKAQRQTNMAATMEKAIELFPSEDSTKHLVMLTDALPNIGIDPEQTTLHAASSARSIGITISIVGIALNEDGVKLAEEIVRIGDGRLYQAKNLEEIDKIILEDYSRIEEN